MRFSHKEIILGEEEHWAVVEERIGLKGNVFCFIIILLFSFIIKLECDYFMYCSFPDLNVNVIYKDYA